MGFYTNDRLMISFSVNITYWGGWNYRWTTHYLFTNMKAAHVSLRRQVLYSILIVVVLPMKLVELIKMCLNEIYINPYR
jgi:hypothetical protein